MDIFITNLLLVIATVGISIHAFSNSTFMQDWMHKPYQVKHSKQWKRLVTNGFIHADYFHLFGNMFTLYFFGNNDKLHLFFYQLTGVSMMASLVFVFFYLSAIVVSSLPAQRKMQDNRGYAALGASGAVSAVMCAAAFLDPLNGIHVFPFSLLFDHGVPGFIFVGLYLWYSHYMSQRQYDQVAHDAHYFGALYGILVVVIISPESISNFFGKIVGFFQYYLGF
ncbi:MAG: rhomboid family intramembrane serine protease [Cytophagaceae bacterium]|jgi:membrane associated rhomboid family serine protease|nr:rhomboid family intramembrane serine protease [Cytophagaceae bacterium]